MTREQLKSGKHGIKHIVKFLREQERVERLVPAPDDHDSSDNGGHGDWSSSAPAPAAATQAPTAEEGAEQHTICS